MGKYSLGRELSFKIIAFTGCLFLASVAVTPAYAITEPPVAPQSTTGISSGGSSQICDKRMYQGVKDQAERMIAVKEDVALRGDSPPENISAVANTPCASQQMASITNQFSNAPSNYAGQVLNAATGNPAGTLVAGVFRSGYNKRREGIASWPQAIGLQSQFNKGMTYVFGQLGLSQSPFADDMCGLMLDALLSYIQCSTNLSLPNLNIPTFQFPGGGECGSQVARNAAYQAASKGSFDILNQKPSNGAVLPRNTPSTGNQP